MTPKHLTKISNGEICANLSINMSFVSHRIRYIDPYQLSLDISSSMTNRCFCQNTKLNKSTPSNNNCKCQGSSEKRAEVFSGDMVLIPRTTRSPRDDNETGTDVSSIFVEGELRLVSCHR